MAVTVRDLEAGDEAAWRRLWAGFLAFNNTDIASEITDHTWARLLDPSNAYWCLVACDNAGEVIGFATHQSFQSTWHVSDVVYLEDLFVDEAARGNGAGKALIDTAMERSRANGYKAYFWQMDKDNQGARPFYDKLTGGPTNRVTYEISL